MTGTTCRGNGKAVAVSMSRKVSGMAVGACATGPKVNGGITDIGGSKVGACSRTINPGTSARIMTIGTVVIMSDSNRAGTGVT